MRDPRVTFAALIVASLLGCNGPRPERLENPWGLQDGGTSEPDAAVAPGTSGTPAGQAGAGSAIAGQPGTAGAAGAPAAAAPGLQLTCPNCAGLCVFGFCLAAPPPAAGPTGGSDAQSACGNGRVGAGETCDPPSSCADSCDDDDSCTVDEESGSAETCDFECSHQEITDCEDDDGCCPDDCNANDDSDCSPSCGNGELEEGETCDPEDSCPDSCDDAQLCTSDLQMGSADDCDLVCSHAAITACGAEEGCCPSSCGPTTDSDCPGCGNGHVESGLGESCDPPGSCPASCDDEDACTVDQRAGEAASCDVVCGHTSITQCIHEDGCCAPDCMPTTDHDCPGCGNGRIEANRDETCDPPGTCVCEDANPCTTNVRLGTPSHCDVTCEFPVITECSSAGDGCCPSGCNFDTDADCEP